MAQTQPTDALAPKYAYRTLSSRYYWSPEIFEKEKSAILYRHWHYAGHISQFAAPGDYLTLRIGKREFNYGMKKQILLSIINALDNFHGFNNKSHVDVF